MSSSLRSSGDLSEVIGWVRPDPRKRLIPAWALGVALVLIGASLCAVFFGGGYGSDISDSLILTGGLLSVLLGMLTMVVSALHVLRDEQSLTFLTEGMSYHDIRGREHRVLWSEVSSIQVVDQSLILTQTSGDEVTLRLDWIPMDLKHLRASLLEVQRRSLMGIPQDISTALGELNITRSSQARHE